MIADVAVYIAHISSYCTPDKVSLTHMHTHAEFNAHQVRRYESRHAPAARPKLPQSFSWSPRKTCVVLGEIEQIKSSKRESVFYTPYYIV